MSGRHSCACALLLADMSENNLFLTGPLQLEAASTGKPTAGRRFKGTAYSGGLVTDWYYPIVIDLASTRIDADFPLLYAHGEPVLGMGNAVQDGGTLQASGEIFSDIDPKAEEIVAKSDRGVGYQYSIGLYGFRVEEVPAGTTRRVNDQDIPGPYSVFLDGRVRELSVTPLGADDKANAAFFAARQTEPPIMPQTTTIAPTPATPAVSDVQASPADLQARLEAAEQRAQAAEAALQAQCLAMRRASIATLVSTYTLELTPEETAALEEAPDVQFAAFASLAAKLHKVPGRLPADLTRDVATEPDGNDQTAAQLKPVYAVYEARRREVGSN
jgi:hypothetical protein